MKKSFLGLSLLSVGFCAGYYLSSILNHPIQTPYRETLFYDTVMIHDTIRMSIPVVVNDSERIASAIRRLPVAASERIVPPTSRDRMPDSVPLVDNGPDSVRVEYPIVRKG